MTSARRSAGLDAALGHVHVRIGLVAVEEVGAARPWPAVRLPWRSSVTAIGTSGPTARAHRGDQVALAVVQALRHHRAVQVEQHAVDRPAPREVGEHRSLTWV